MLGAILAVDCDDGVGSPLRYHDAVGCVHGCGVFKLRSGYDVGTKRVQARVAGARVEDVETSCSACRRGLRTVAVVRG